MSIISVNNLTFAYEGGADYIFKDATFMLDTDWRLGLVGRNGRGKTTLLRLFSKQIEHTGSISASVDFSYFPFEIKDESVQTADIIDGLVPNLEEWRLIKELNLLEVEIDCLYRPFGLLSGGEKSKIMLAALFIKENNFLLIDEPTNHLDANARQTVARYLATKKSFILVSHDRTFLDGAVDHIMSINRANIEVQKGNFSSYQLNKERQDCFEKAQNEKLRGEIDRLKTAAKRNTEWSQKGHRESTGGDSSDERQIGYKEFHRKKAGKLDSQAKQMEKRFDKMLDEKSKLLKNVETPFQLKINPLKHHSDRLVEARNLSISYGDKTIFDNVNLIINQGDRVAISGKNGCGKSSLIKLILAQSGGIISNSAIKGRATNSGSAINDSVAINGSGTINSGGDAVMDFGSMDYSGQMWLAPSLKISYVSQDTSFLRGRLVDFAERNNLNQTLFMAILSKLDFSKSQFDKDIADFSAGQKKKVLLAKSLSQSSNLYIWDEPLNFIDIYSRMQIESLIKQHAPTMLFVEHDAAFTDAIATDILAM